MHSQPYGSFAHQLVYYTHDGTEVRGPHEGSAFQLDDFDSGETKVIGGANWVRCYKTVDLTAGSNENADKIILQYPISSCHIKYH